MRVCVSELGAMETMENMYVYTSFASRSSLYIVTIAATTCQDGDGLC